jgi:hypothetical protein
MMTTDITIFAFNDRIKRTIYGFVPESSPAVLPQEGYDWEEVVKPGFVSTANLGNWINTEVRESIQIRGYCVVDFESPVTVNP